MRNRYRCKHGGGDATAGDGGGGDSPEGSEYGSVRSVLELPKAERERK